MTFEAREEVALLLNTWESLSQPGPYKEAIGSVLEHSMPYRDFCVELDLSVTLAVEVGAASGTDIAKPIRQALAANGHSHQMAKYATGAALALSLSAEHQARGAAGAAEWLDGLREEGNLGVEHPHDFFFDVDEYFGPRHPFVQGWHALNEGDLNQLGRIVDILTAQRRAVVQRFEEGEVADMPWSVFIAPKLCWLVRAARESLDPTFSVPTEERSVWLYDL
jgi:hypothetical protein